MLRSVVVFLFLTGSAILGYGQVENSQINNVFLGSLHLANYFNSDEFVEYKSSLGVGIEYRRKVKTISEKFHLSVGANIESIPLKRVHENGDFYIYNQFNFTIPFGIYYTSLRSYYIGLYTSFDFPFANKENSEFGGMSFKNTEFSPRFLNLNFSAGINVGKVIYIKDQILFFELHYKSVAVLGFKSNDYWMYPDESSPYYWGMRIGIGF